MFPVNPAIQYAPSLKLKIKKEQNGITSVTRFKSVISILPSASMKKLEFAIVLPSGNSIVYTCIQMTQLPLWTALATISMGLKLPCLKGYNGKLNW